MSASVAMDTSLIGPASPASTALQSATKDLGDAYKDWWDCQSFEDAVAGDSMISEEAINAAKANTQDREQRVKAAQVTCDQALWPLGHDVKVEVTRRVDEFLSRRPEAESTFQERLEAMTNSVLLSQLLELNKVDQLLDNPGSSIPNEVTLESIEKLSTNLLLEATITHLADPDPSPPTTRRHSIHHLRQARNNEIEYIKGKFRRANVTLSDDGQTTTTTTAPTRSAPSEGQDVSQGESSQKQVETDW